MPVDLPSELDFGLLDIVDLHVAPRQPAQLRDPGASERGQCEQRAEWLMRGCDCLLQLLADEDGTALVCEIFGRSEESISVVGMVPFHPSRRAANL
jgi:hypothetical protein